MTNMTGLTIMLIEIIIISSLKTFERCPWACQTFLICNYIHKNNYMPNNYIYAHWKFDVYYYYCKTRNEWLKRKNNHTFADLIIIIHIKVQSNRKDIKLCHLLVLMNNQVLLICPPRSNKECVVFHLYPLCEKMWLCSYIVYKVL